MKKTRVKRGKEYYFININFEVMSDYEYETDIDNIRFDNNNYFVTEEEAETMARKLRAVLKGADVIEPLNENDILKARTDFDVLAKNLDEKGLGYTNIKDAQGAFLVGIQWRNSKIVK